jgi:hypothetical protein
MALRDIDDLFEMIPASASIQGPLIGCLHGSFRLTYERALVVACPILLLFMYHCGISARTKFDVPITRKPRLALLKKSGVRLRSLIGDPIAVDFSLPL